MSAWYVFGVVPAEATPPRGTYLIERGELGAVASQVSLVDFGEDVLPERLNDRAWLEQQVRRHEEVLQSFVDRTPVVPLRFGTVYRDVDHVRALLAERDAFFADALERLRGHIELGVKAWYDPSRVERAPAADGRSYLQRRRSELSASKDAFTVVAEAHDRLRALAIDGVVNRPQPHELTGRSERMLLNAAYLVSDGGERLASAVRTLNEEHGADGIEFELTGPWPPYNFTHDDRQAS